MKYKELNVYQRAYKTAIDLHLALNAKEIKCSPESDEGLRRVSREILGFIAETVNSQGILKIKLNARAIQCLKTMGSYLEEMKNFMNEDNYKHLSGEYQIVLNELSNNVLVK